MKSLKTIGRLAAIAIAAIMVSGCEIENSYYDDNEYHRRSWWDNSYDYPSTDLLAMAQTLRGHWDGRLVARGRDASGYVGVKTYYTDIEFDQYNSNAIYGRGRQVDYDGANDPNPFRRSFSWRIDTRTRAIIIDYDYNNYTMTIAYNDFNLNDNAFSGVMRGPNETNEFSLARYTLAKKGSVDFDSTADSTATK